MTTKKTIANLVKELESIGLVYFDRKKIERLDYRTIAIKFCLPRNSLFLLIEFCKCNGLLISYMNRGNGLEISFKTDSSYDKYW